MRRAPSGVVPARGQLRPGKRLALFAEMAERASADVVRIKKIGELPAAVADYLRSQNLPAALRIGEAALLAELSWDDAQIAVSRLLPGCIGFRMDMAGLAVGIGARCLNDPVCRDDHTCPDNEPCHR